jgi:hypothetical protein
MITATLTRPPSFADRLARLDVGAMAEAVATRMRDHWRANMLGGVMADGQPLPTNRKGEPLGVGSGTIITGWKVERSGDSATVSPYQGGEYSSAVRYLVNRGVVYHSLEDNSRPVFDGALANSKDAALTAAMGSR